MLHILTKAMKLKRNISGATALEYGLIVTAIAIGIVSAVFMLGGDLASFFSSLSDTVVEKTTN